MKIAKQMLLASLPLLVFFGTSAFAGIKVDKAAVAKLEKVAVVGYSFFRWDVVEEPSLFKMKREEIVLAEDDPEFIVMQEAADRTMQAIAKGGSFTVIPRSEVVANPTYQSSTTDPEKKKIMNWYFPDEYRVIKLKKGNAKALCEALGVDAVVQIAFSYSGKGSKSSAGGISWGKSYLVMKGGVTMIDKNGKTLLSGKVKSDKVKRSSSIGFGNAESSGGSTDISTGEAGSGLYPNLLNSFLDKFEKDLGF